MLILAGLFGAVVTVLGGLAALGKASGWTGPNSRVPMKESVRVVKNPPTPGA
jgi:hypothetical protein